MKTTIQFISLTLLAMMLTATVFAAQITVQGKIYDAQDKTPIWGATIRIVGDSLVVVSNSEGVFSIVANKGDLLEIHMIGYLMRRVKVKESAMTIYLQPNKEVLEQVVIVGGTQASAQALMTESVSRIRFILKIEIANAYLLFLCQLSQAIMQRRVFLFIMNIIAI